MTPETVPLRELTSAITKGTTPTTVGREFADTGIPFIRVQNLKCGRVDLAIDQLFISSRTHAALSRSVVRSGDVLVSIAGTIGRTAVVGSELPEMNCNQRYLFHWLNTTDAQDQMVSSGVTGTITNLSLSQLGNLAVPLRPVSEQRRIAAILDQADALRIKRQVAIGKLELLTRSLFADTFGDPITNPKCWPTKRIGDIVRVRRGGSPRPIEQFLGGTINWIKIGDATDDDDIYITRCADKIVKAGLSKTLFLKSGSLIFANCGVSLGFARILKLDGCIHDGWLALDDIPEETLNKIFFLKALNTVTARFRKMAPEGTQPNLNTTLIKTFEIILPPISLQQAFAQHVERTLPLRATHRVSLAKLDTLFASLQHRAFRGEL